MNNDEIKLLHSLELKILLEIKRICEKNNITFFLAFGSLLGAVRHKGFIPWDDDLDIAMPRDDYEKFIKVFNDETNKDEFFMENWDTEKEFGLSFTKIKLNGTIFEENSISKTKTHKGIFVDIFPYDRLTTDKKVIKKVAKQVLTLGKIYKFKLNYLPTNSNNKKQLIQSKLIKFICFPLSLKSIRNRLYNIETQFNNDKAATNVAFISGAYNLRDYFNLEYLDEVTYIPFENILMPVPKEYDKVLTAIYGDYMKLPPEEKRVFRHNAKIVDFGKYRGEYND